MIAFLTNASAGVSPSRYQLTTLNYIYYRMNLGASSKPVSRSYACNISWIFILISLTHPLLTSQVGDIHISMYCACRPVHSEVCQLNLSFRFIRILTLFIQLKHHELHHPIG